MGPLGYEHEQWGHGDLGSTGFGVTGAIGTWGRGVTEPLVTGHGLTKPWTLRTSVSQGLGVDGPWSQWALGHGSQGHEFTGPWVRGTLGVNGPDGHRVLDHWGLWSLGIRITGLRVTWHRGHRASGSWYGGS